MPAWETRAAMAASASAKAARPRPGSVTSGADADVDVGGPLLVVASDTAREVEVLDASVG
ncbi:MAG: hypothetical protein R2699_00785 [Acidimicrobiales bacterium]